MTWIKMIDLNTDTKKNLIEQQINQIEKSYLSREDQPANQQTGNKLESQ